MKKQNSYTVCVENGKKGLDIFINDGIKNHYIMTRRPNYLIWDRLKNGIRLNELRQIKPHSGRNEKKYYESVCHLLRIVDNFFKYELTV